MNILGNIASSIFGGGIKTIANSVVKVKNAFFVNEDKDAQRNFAFEQQASYLTNTKFRRAIHD